jgi:hypothetical protein
LGEASAIVGRCYHTARQCELLEEIVHYVAGVKRAAEVLGEAIQLLETVAAEQEHAHVQK